MSKPLHRLQSAGENPAETMDFVAPLQDVVSKKGNNDSGSSLESEDVEIAQAMNLLKESPATFRRPSKATAIERPTRKSSKTESPPGSPSKQKRRSKSSVMEHGDDGNSVTSMRRRRTRSKDPQKESSSTRRSLSRDATSHRQRSSSRDLVTETSTRRLRPTSNAVSPKSSRSFIKSTRTGSRSVADSSLLSPTSNVSQRSSRTLTSRPVTNRVKSKAALFQSPENSTHPHRSHSTDAETTRRTRSQSRDASTRVHRSRSRDASSRATDSPGRLSRLSKRSVSSAHVVSTHSRGDMPGPTLESPTHEESLAELEPDEKHHHHHANSHHRHHHRTDDDDVSVASTIYSMEPSRGVSSSNSSDDMLETTLPMDERPRLRGRRPRPEKSASLPTTAVLPPEVSPVKATSSRSFRRKVGSPTSKPKKLETSPKTNSPKASRASPLTGDRVSRSSSIRTSPMPLEKSSRSSTVRGKPSSHVEKPSSTLSLESERPVSSRIKHSPPVPGKPSSVRSQSPSEIEKKPNSFMSLESERPMSNRSNPSPTISDFPSSSLLHTFDDLDSGLQIPARTQPSPTIPLRSKASPSTSEIHSSADPDIHHPIFPPSILDAFADFDFDDKAASNPSLLDKHSSAQSFSDFDIDRPLSNSSISVKPSSNQSLPFIPASGQHTSEQFIADFDKPSSKPISVRSKASFIPSEPVFDTFVAFDAHAHEDSGNKPPSLDELFAAAYEKDKAERTRTLEELFASQQPLRTDKAASVSDLFGSVPNFSVGSLPDASVCSSPAASCTADRALLKQSPNHGHSRLGNHFRIRSWGNFAALLAEPSLSSGGTRDDHSDATSLGSGNLSSVGTPKPLRRGLKKSRSFGDVSHIISGGGTAPRRGKKPTTTTHSNQSFSDCIMGMPEAAVAATTSAKDGEICVIRASHTGHTTRTVDDDFELNDSSDTDHNERQQEYLQLCLPSSTDAIASMATPIEIPESPLQPPEGGGLLTRRLRGTTANMASSRKAMLPPFRGRQRKEEEEEM